MVTSTNLDIWPLSSFRFAEWLSEERRTRVADASAAVTESAQTPAQVDPSPEPAPEPVPEAVPEPAASEAAAPIIIAPVITEETVIIAQPPVADQDRTSAEETEVANAASKEEELGEDANATTTTTTMTIIKEEIIVKEEVQNAYVNFPYVPRAEYVKDTTYDAQPVDPSPYVPHSHDAYNYRSGYTANPAYNESSSDSGYNTTWSSYTSLYSSPAPYGSAYNTTTGNYSGSSTYVPPPPPFEGGRLTPSFQQRAVDAMEPSYSADSSYRSPRYKGDLWRFFVIDMESLSFFVIADSCMVDLTHLNPYWPELPKMGLAISNAQILSKKKKYLLTNVSPHVRSH